MFVGEEPRVFVVGRDSDKPEQDVSQPAIAPTPRPVLPPPARLAPPSDLDGGVDL